MLAADQQVVEAYEQLGLSPEQIAQELSWDIAAVKLSLLTNSSKFNQDNKQLIKSGEQPLFENADIEAAKQVQRQLLYSEVDAVRFRASRFIIDEVKGRNDIKQIKQSNMNIVMIHQQMARAKEAVKRAIDIATNPNPTPAELLTNKGVA